MIYGRQMANASARHRK
jgi:hypothetical protein